jgi:hypothetical protein
MWSLFQAHIFKHTFNWDCQQESAMGLQLGSLSCDLNFLFELSLSIRGKNTQIQYFL